MSIKLQAVKCIRFDNFGEPSKVLHLDQIDLGQCDDIKCALVRWLASPVNPVDFYIIKGQYGGYKPKLPAIGGVEAVGIVEKIGENSKEIEVGDRVIRYKMPSNQCACGGGLWTEFSFMPIEALLKIDERIELTSAAMLAINPPTAFAILTQIVPLNNGDCVVQNGANSGVGRAVIQLAKHFGYRTINLVRSSCDEDTCDQLRSLGADWIFKEEEFGQIIAGPHKLPECKLGLNGVGGQSACLVSKALENGAILVTYGEISGCESKCVEGIKQTGFSIARFCSDKQNCDKVTKMFAELQKLLLEGKLRPPPTECHQIGEFKSAVQNAICHGTKQILLLGAPEHLQTYKRR